MVLHDFIVTSKRSAREELSWKRKLGAQLEAAEEVSTWAGVELFGALGGWEPGRCGRRGWGGCKKI